MPRAPEFVRSIAEQAEKTGRHRRIPAIWYGRCLSEYGLITTTMNRSHAHTTSLPSVKRALAHGEGIRRNRLLEALPAGEIERLLPSLESVPLTDGMPIYEPNEPVTRVYFPTDGIISLVSEMAEGTVEVGTIGRDGMTGLPLVLRATTMPSRAFVQVPGHAYCMSDDDFLAAMRDSPAFERLLFRYALGMFDQAAQHAACNRLHTLEERCARWLLMTHDRVDGDVLLLKQQFLAEMLGVHRPAVTIAAGALQKAGVIRYSRGKVTVLDRDALERSACKCYRIIARRAEELLDLETSSDHRPAGYETVRN